LESEEVQVGSKVGDDAVAASHRSRVARGQDSCLERRNLGGDVGNSAKEERDAKHNPGNPLFKRCDRDGEWQAAVEEAQGEENEEQRELDARRLVNTNRHKS
jgi:hypothetical protein